MVDKSRKGMVDAPIEEMITEINLHPDLTTTSSCSGRIVVYQKLTNIRKENCNWILVLHEKVTACQLTNSLGLISAPGMVFVKFEPFILHCRCNTQKIAREMLVSGLNSGFRESGIVIGKQGQFITAIRSSQIMEVPLTDENGNVMVSTEYLELIVGLLNERMRVTAERRIKFHEALRSRLLTSRSV